jgi:hypothetical protein
MEFLHFKNILKPTINKFGMNGKKKISKKK